MSSVFLNKGEGVSTSSLTAENFKHSAEKADRVTTFRKTFSAYVPSMKAVGVWASRILSQHPLGQGIVSLIRS